MTDRDFKRCVKKMVREFDRYDRQVDVVTCWENFLRQQYGHHFPKFNFDRFPDIVEDEVDPTFTAYFNDEYGLVFEAYHSVSGALIDSEIEYVKFLDSGIEIKDKTGEKKQPDEMDIVLLVDSDSAQTFGHKLDDEINNGDFDPNGNIVLLEYDFVDENDQPKYRFKRSAVPGDNFRDNALPGQRKLSRKLSPKGGEFENLQIPIDENFTEFKATGMITNKSPAKLYFACRLWNDIFIEHLDDDEIRTWEREDPQQTLPIKVEVDELQSKLNTDLIPEANVKSSWIVEALEYLSVAGAAKKLGNGEFRVDFRNLHDKRRKYSSTTSARSEVSDLAWLFSEWHCENKIEKDASELADFILAESVDKASLSGLGKTQLGDF